jgi:DNA repair protein RadA/Sms
MVSKSGGIAGTLGQIRECMHLLITFAKSTGIPVIIVGHITKEGMIAGPKMLEHMVDTVLYFEGEGHRPYRILRSIKNRFGATHEVGIFDMTEKGLQEVSNPSCLFTRSRQGEVSGACVFAGMEGSRPLFVEFQALAAPSFLMTPRRSVVGWDVNRLSMVLAILESRCQIPFSKKDVFLTVLGGIKVSEPAADLCVALSLLSCLKKRPLPHRAIAFGEMGLTGEIYSPSFGEHRLREAEQLGFTHVFMPGGSSTERAFTPVFLNHVKDLDLWFRP